MSNIFSHQSLCVFTPSPYPTLVRSIFPFRNNKQKLILTGRRSRSTSVSSTPPQQPISSSDDLVLISTTEHRDGSIIFRFGDASEVVENDNVVEEIETKVEQESTIVKVLDGDQEREVIVKRIESGDADTDSVIIDKRETKFTSDPSNSHEKSSDRLSDIYEEVVLSAQSEAKQIDSLEIVREETDSTAQLDGDESSNPSISLLDNNPNRDKSADTPGTLIKDGDDETEDPSVSVKFESMQVSKVEVMDVKQPYDENESDKVKSEDTAEGLMPPASMPILDVELTDAANEDFEEALQDRNISDGTLIAEMPPSDLSVEPTLDAVEVTMEVSSIEAVIVTDQAVEYELQEASTNNKEENDVSVVMPISRKEETELTVEEDDGILQVKESDDLSVSDEPETVKVSDIEAQDAEVTDESEDPSVSVRLETIQISDIELLDTMEERLQDMKISEGSLIDGMLSSDLIRAEPTVDEAIQIQSSNLELEAGMEVSTTNGMDVKDWSVDDELQQVSIDYRDQIDVVDVMTCQEQDSIPIELKPTMQVSDVEIQDATSQNLDDGIFQVINEEAGVSFTVDVEQLSHKLEGQPVQDEGENHSILEEYLETDAPGISILLKQDARDPLPEAENTEENVSSSEVAEASKDTALLLAAEAKVKREGIYLTGKFLSSGAAFLEHPYKALTGGDDAYFVAGDKWLGVANGVSQWSFEGTYPGVYAQELMKTCEDIVLNTRSVPVTNPVELLCRGVKETNMSGSSNVLIANFDGQALHVANIGDTGFLIIRHGAIYKKSSPLLHEFHFALQVEDSDNPLQLMEECRIELEEGDIIVCATDGLFDNLYEREIAMIVSRSLQAEMKPQEIANVLATRAQEVGKSAFVRSPFSDAAQAAGYTGYVGGKPDNVAVIVSLVEKRSNLLGE